MKCPKCDSPEIRPSSRSKWLDIFESKLGREAYRCRKCRHRFYANLEPGAASGAKRTTSKSKHEVRRGTRRVRPWMVETAIFVIMLLLFYVFLRYLTREPATSEGLILPESVETRA